MRRSIDRVVVASTLALLSTAVGCAGRTAQADAAPTRDVTFVYAADPELAARLQSTPGPAQLASLMQWADSTGADLLARLVTLLDDPEAPVVARANAALAIGSLRATRHLIALSAVLRDAPEAVRVAAVTAIRELMPGEPEAATRVLSRTLLEDTSVAVQTKVLEAVADRDVALLRAYLQGNPPLDQGQIAAELVRVAEERGAPWGEPLDDGMLTRTSSTGHRLRFRARKSWPQWDAAAGELEVQPRGGTRFVIGEVEAVRRVVPAFFSADGRYLVYEAGRHIHVRDLTTGTVRAVGEGVAPRPLPFTETFAFLRELPESRNAARETTRLRYQVYREPFAAPTPSEPDVIGMIGAESRMDRNGGYSPVRWMRVQETAGQFVLIGDGMDRLVLPDPFGSGS